MINSIMDWLEHTSLIYPDKTVYIDNAGGITFGGLLASAKKIAGGIIEKDISNSPVVILIGREIRTIQAYLGVAYSGNFYAPIDVSLPKDRIVKMLEVVEPSLIITSGQYEKLADEVVESYGNNCTIMLIEELLDSSFDEKLLCDVRDNITGTSPLYIVFTSGSSGIPKAVLTSHLSLITYITAYVEALGITADDIIGGQAPLDYIAAIRDIYVPLYVGATTFFLDKNLIMQPEKMFDEMNRNNINVIGWSTSSLGIIASVHAFDNIKPDRLSIVCFSGSKISGKVLSYWQKALPNTRFINQYGPTEATASCCYYIVDHFVKECEDIPIGLPYNNYTVYLLDDNGKEVNEGELGEICIAGPGVTMGYYRDEERTAKAFVPNTVDPACSKVIYKTGDYGRLRPDGLLEFHGRMDRQIKHMGHRVELDEIEQAAGVTEGVFEAACIYDEQKEKLVLFYCGDVDKKQIMIKLREYLPGYMLPRKIVRLMNMPRLANGKINMKELEENEGI